MDILMCFVARDFRIIKKTVKFLRKNIQKDDDTIYIVGSIKNKRFFSEKWISDNNVVLLDENRLVEGLSFSFVSDCLADHIKARYSTGWYLQQFLKMGFALSPYAKNNYLIWDSDTVPVRHIEMQAHNGKYYLAAKTENHKPYFDTLKKLLGFGKQEVFSYIAEHMVIDTNIMKEIINCINNSAVKGEFWFEKIINATSPYEQFGFSEFETYGNYCSVYHPGLFEIRELRTLREAGMLFGRGVTDYELETLARMGFDTASFESYDVPHNYRGWVNRFDQKLVKLLDWFDKAKK